MKLIEADGKALLRRHGLPVPEGELLAPGQEPSRDWPDGAVAKAQILAGGRGLRGLVRVAGGGEVGDVLAGVREAIRADGPDGYVLLERKVVFSDEHYMAVRVNDVAQCPELLFSRLGGVHVESHGDAVQVFRIDPLQPLRPYHLVAFFKRSGAAERSIGALCRFAVQLHGVFVAEDAELVEVNPLAVTERGQVTALDAKVVLDGAADFRHLDRREMLSARLHQESLGDLERRGAAHGITFVELPGDIAVMTGGAGLGMAVLDALVDAGFQPANFVDTISGSGSDQFQKLGELVMEHAARDHVRAILAYFTLSATSLKGLAQGLERLFLQNPPPKPIVIGMHASGAATAELSLADAQALFRAKGYGCETELSDLVARLREVVGPQPAL